MKAHELARKLLEGPDVPVISEYGEDYDLEEIEGVKPWPRPDEIGSHDHWAGRDGMRWDQAVELT